MVTPAPSNPITDSDQTRRLEYVPLDDLESALVNPKGHDAQVIARGIDRFGLIDIPTLDERTGRLIAGHGRRDDLLARRAAGQAPPKRSGVTVDDQGRWMVPTVRGWASRDDNEAHAAGVTLNQATVAGGFDLDQLGELARDLNAVDETLVAALGFDDDTLATLLADPEPPAASLGDPDEIPDTAPALTQPGDLWELGPHRLLCSDSRNPDDVARLMDRITPDLLLTDPPYCSGGFQEAGRAGGSIGVETHVDGIRPSIANDRLSTRGYTTLLRESFALTQPAALYVFTDWRMWTTLADIVEASGFGLRAMVVWDKGSPGMGHGWRSQHELVLHGVSAAIKYDKHAPAIGNVRAYPRTGNPDHPTQKPVDLIRDLLKVCAPARTVYDPFAGSGTTILAAHIEGRTAYAMELDPGFCDVACRRWQTHTGIKPVRDGTPHDFTQDP